VRSFLAMTQISSTFSATRLTPRTADYVASLIREGNNFDYGKWLERVREKEAQATSVRATFTLGEGHPFGPPNSRGARQYSGPALMTRATALPRVIRRPSHEPARKTATAQVHRWLAEIHNAWDAFQANRARDAVYGYLEAVFAIVRHYKTRRKTKKLLRHSFKFAGLPLDRNADPVTAVIRCTSADNIDSKTISKWARALRYVARCKVPPTRLKAFMKEVGGVNACADRYAKAAT
jgi:hypothetical protein